MNKCYYFDSKNECIKQSLVKELASILPGFGVSGKIHKLFIVYAEDSCYISNFDHSVGEQVSLEDFMRRIHFSLEKLKKHYE